MTRYDATDDLPADLADLEPDDRLDQSIVGRVAEMYDDPNVDRPIVLISMLELTNSVHAALAVAPDHDLLMTIGCHGKGEAWTQAERDWKIRQIGTDYEINNAEIDIIPESETPDDPAAHVAGWVETVVGDRLLNPTEYGDELHMSNPQRLRLYDPYGPARAYCTIGLID